MKVLAVNGSPHKEGGTYQAIKIIAQELEKNNIQTEIIQLGTNPIHGCTGCGQCGQSHKCVFTDDIVNSAIEKMNTCDGLILGSPVYYAGVNGAMKCFLDRFFYAGASTVNNKVATSVVSVRRAGGVATFDQMNHFLFLAQAVIVPSIYWSVVHGTNEQALNQDEEGIQMLQTVGKNMSWLLQALETSKTTITPPEPPKSKIRTSFIR